MILPIHSVLAFAFGQWLGAILIFLASGGDSIFEATAYGSVTVLGLWVTSKLIKYPVQGGQATE